MILHVVDAAEDSITIFLGTGDRWGVPRFMSISVFSRREAAFFRLRAVFASAEKGLVVASEMLAKVAASGEDSLRRAVRVSATPTSPVSKRDPKVVEV